MKLKEMFRCLFAMEEYQNPHDFTYFTGYGSALRCARQLNQKIEEGSWYFPEMDDGRPVTYGYRVFTDHNRK